MESKEQGIGYIGIDPGMSGGIAIIYTKKGSTPNMIHVPCGKTPHDMLWSISTLLEDLNDEGTTHWVAVLEKVHSMPGQGVASTFKFGMNYGTWIGILTTMGIPYTLTTPQRWMKHYGAMPKDKRERKNYIKAMAQALYPKSGRITLATSDAVLIAHYNMEDSHV